MPLRLVLDRELCKYQLLFRHLLRIRVIMIKVETHVKPSPLRVQILNFLKNFQYHCQKNVITPAKKKFMTLHPHCKTIYELQKMHSSLLDELLDGCMLTKHDILDRMVAVIAVIDATVQDESNGKTFPMLLESLKNQLKLRSDVDGHQASNNLSVLLD